MNISDKIIETGIVPVVVLDKSEDAVPLAKALLAGGINFMEITLRTSCALDSIKSVSQNVEGMIVGAGTVINKDQAKAAVEAGAKFIVSPGLDEETVIWCNENNITCCPGCVTPTEIMKAISLGLKVVKFFPANVYGGIKAIKALSGPFGDIKFLPTGGVSADNMEEFLEVKSIAAVGGSWVCTKTDVNNGEFEKITKLSKEATDIIKKVRG
ncbi:MAG: bifunctional 4-hydroxy-2-oxoglutarate aldolase/2-dehydro-3-deoxy-phosphogluconate aldolase [Clostridia bacterium]|nr:bifunctional 4-hydroxy-2-oxoglutarate aldolase/2-dehydro-3-deoxy-phosphogluconate aldolase [Clostridia bacterium]